MEYRSMECPEAKKAIVCDALNEELGGRVLGKNPDYLLQELSNIGHQVADTARKNQQMAARVEMKEQQRYDALQTTLDGLTAKYESSATKLEGSNDQLKSLSEQLCKISKNNRRNSEKLFDAKAKLIKSQNTRKLLYELHNVDDGSLNQKIHETNNQIFEQDTDLVDMTSRIDELQKMIDAVVSATQTAKIEADNQDDRLKVVKTLKDSLNKENSSLLSQTDELLVSIIESQNKMLNSSCQQKTKSFTVQQLKTSQTTKESLLANKTSDYNSLCCEYKNKKRALEQGETALNTLTEEICLARNQIKETISNNHALESKIKQVNKKIQEKDYDSASAKMSGHQNC